MKFSDINENLTEGPLSGPAGFGKRVKAKAQKHLTPFNKVQQRVGTAKDKQYKEAKKIKQEFMVWKKMEGMSPKVYPTMPAFLEWIKGVDAKLGAAVEKVARSDKDYAEFFTTAIDKKGKAAQTASDPKVNVRDDDPDATGDKSKKVSAPSDEGDFELEQELELADEEVEEEVDMSASIYEARLRAFLNEDGEDVGVQNSKQLADNQIDTLIVKGIELRDKGGAGADSGIQKAADGIANAKSKSDDELEMSRVSNSSISGGDIESIKDTLDEFMDDVKNVIRRQDGIEDSVKKQLSDKIDDLVYDMINNSF